MTSVAQANKQPESPEARSTLVCALPPSLCVAVERLREHKYEKNAV